MKTLAWGTLVALAVVLLARGAAAWTVVGQAGFSPSNVNALSLALQSGGTPHLAFLGPADGNKAQVWKFTGGDWTPVGGGPVPPHDAWQVSLAFSPAGTGVPLLAFTASNGFNATVTKAGASRWAALGSSGLPKDAAWPLHLATTPAGGIFVAYLSFQSTDRKATVKKYTSSVSPGGRVTAAWAAVGKAGFSPGSSDTLSMAVTTSGVPFVAVFSGGKLTVMKHTGGAGSGWAAVGKAGFASSDAPYLRLALSRTGVPFVAFKDTAKGGKVTVMKHTGGGGSGWAAVGKAGFSPTAAFDISLALTAAGVPLVAFTDSNLKANVMRHTGGGGSGWAAVGKAAFSPGRCYLTELALTAAGMPYVAFIDEANGYRATVMTGP